MKTFLLSVFEKLAFFVLMSLVRITRN